MIPPISLVPFERTPSINNISLEVSIEGQQSFLLFKYVLDGGDEVSWPEELSGLRKHRLWEETCFEVFFETENGRYVEVNVTPNHDWNVYEFESYRGKASTWELDLLPLVTTKAIGKQKILEFRLEKKLLPEKILRTGLSVILKEKSGVLSYWAIRHLPEKPDFHRMENWEELFLLRR